MIEVHYDLYAYLLEIGAILESEHRTAEQKVADVKYKMELLAGLLNDT